jgi:hypothetical protein
MRLILLITFFVSATLFAVPPTPFSVGPTVRIASVHRFAASSPPAGPPTPQNPRDPFKDLQRRAEKEASEKNYKELKDAAAELAELSKQISADIDEGGKDVISAHIFERLDKIEKLAKKIREKAKGSPRGEIRGQTGEFPILERSKE